MWDKISGAISGSDTKLVRFYLEQEPEIIFEQNYQDETLLHHAARSADAETILELLRHGARADNADDFGWTPLHEACRSKNEAAVAIFMTTGINLDMRTSKQETPLHVATRHNAYAIMARLLEAGAKSDITNKDGDTALHLAAMRGYARAVEVLITAGVNLRARNHLGLTALHMTALKGHFRCAVLLLNNKANPHQLDDSGKSFLELADICGNDLFVTHAKTVINEIEQKENQIAIDPASEKKSGKAASEIRKPKLADFYNDLTTEPENRFQKTCTLVVNGLISGQGSPDRSGSLRNTIENVLWFLVFPFLLFVLWKGFASGALPSAVHLNFSFGKIASAEFLQTLVNTLLVIVASSMLITTENASMSSLHFFKDMRETVHFRVVHLMLIEVFYIGNLIIDTAFFAEFGIFWGWFSLLYVASYLIWWLNTHAATTEASSANTEICYADN
ncbi:MAG: hypothetical protein CVV42_10700 [Candidatus Riflebacteria bacterium HGW-Riflebacteria-2]|jgi:ankyrin repeat protein|nr:MAG: hypothetical protein CVV42_10700 [Candidatus Riflebacteria bacterium HGW-Riflebacteria-2]